MSTTRKVTIPGGLDVFFQDRQAMKLGHPSALFGLKGSFPSIVLPVDWSMGNSLSFPIDGNNLFSDCMYAAACHGDNTFTGNTGTEQTFDLTSLLFEYEKLSGGDNGLTTGQIIQAWKKGLARTPAAYINQALSLDPNDVAAMQAAIYFFGGVFFMLNVPKDWWSNWKTDAVWDAPAKPDDNNGHAVWWNGVDNQGRYKFQSWGSHGWLTPAGVKVCDPSCFVVFSPRWFNSQGVAPNGYTYDQLAALWVQFGGQALPYQNRVLEVATTFAGETDGTWLMADYDRDGTPDLVFIKTGTTPSGNVEVHIASGATKYQKRILEVPTTFASESDGTWLMADYDRDGIPDLVFIKTGMTPSGNVEVHIASGATKYQKRILEVPTTFASETDGTWLMADYDRDGIPDLVFIKTGKTPSGNVEVHIASGATKYQKRILEIPTTFASETDGTWLMADYDGTSLPDLVFIRTGNSTIGQVEVHVASGSSKYQTRTFESPTTFNDENDGVWLISDYSKSKMTDLVFIKTPTAPNQFVEVHIATR